MRSALKGFSLDTSLTNTGHDRVWMTCTSGAVVNRNMSDVFFAELGLQRPKYNLGIHGGGHGAMTGQMLCALEEILLQEHPAAIMVYGDTNSTLAGALAAAKLCLVHDACVLQRGHMFFGPLAGVGSFDGIDLGWKVSLKR